MTPFLLPVSRLRRFGYAAAATALCLTAVGAASATGTDQGAAPRPQAGGPITSETLSEGDTTLPFRIKAEGPRHLLYRKATIPPGTATGWHYHPGSEIAVIASGTLTRVNGDDCRVRVLGPGDALVEPTGPKEVHYGVNRGTEPVVLYITDVLPKGAPVSVPADNPGCPTAR
ncbi:cupin domain-containing protein [Streptomyces sp. 71268]|uniref:cupin domain-containing protein n=1 Tax=Streptomyces sp. 71268 TaxID=3002640 RepID=UPI0023F88298|nr:cupin domain-containing protein [Streptomyces sp. 71268]WEV24258.1 cupin domain-containing protein [Streptomyces sp. 71268]